MEKDKNSYNFKYLIMGRHGERADFAHKKDKSKRKELRDGDAQLTDVGIDQAKQTGNMICKILNGLNIKKVKMFSSPGIRTLQTAMLIADAGDIGDVETHDGFIDYNIKRYMPIPLDQIELRTKGNHPGSECRDNSDNLEHCVTQRNQFYFNGIEHIKIIDTGKYTEAMTLAGIESQSKGWKRVKRYIEDILDNWNEISTEDQSIPEAIVIATHAEGLDAFTYTFTKEYGEIDYGATTILKFDIESKYSEIIMERDYAWRKKSY